jgi:hypothetical protein
MTPPAPADSYKHHRFPGAIISHAVWLYCRFPLRHRDVAELWFVRGVSVSYEALRTGCRKFGQASAPTSLSKSCEHRIFIGIARGGCDPHLVSSQPCWSTKVCKTDSRGPLR